MRQLLVGLGMILALQGTATGQVLWFRLPTAVYLGTEAVQAWDGRGTSHPAVVHRDGTYHLWYLGEGDAGRAIGYARSTDGVLWESFPGNPVVTDGTGQAWDAELISHPHVVWDGTRYRMWYSGYDGVLQRIGLALSGDGVTWQKHGVAVLSPGDAGAWDGAGVSGPCVLSTGSGYTMFYAGYDGQHLRIGRATSRDGVTWQKVQTAPVLDLGEGEAWDREGVSDPAVLYDGRSYRMWYTGFDGELRRLGYATSANGVTWEKLAGDPVLAEGNEGTWNSAGLSGPAVVQVGGTYRLWYTGSDGQHLRLGYATSQIPGDIDGDGAISAMDAVLVLQYVIRLIDDFPVQLLTLHKEVQPLPSYEVSLGRMQARAGARVPVPLTVVDGRGLYAGGMRVAYDPTVLRAVEAVPRPLLNGSFWQTSIERPGEVSCAFVGAGALTEGGELFTLTFEVLDHDLSCATPLTLVEAAFNDGVEVIRRDGAVEALPITARLLSACPNPFNPRTTIGFTIPADGRVQVTVHNPAGQTVAHLVDADLAAGTHQTVWNGLDDSGRPAASGVYLCRLVAGGAGDGQKLLLVR